MIGILWALKIKKKDLTKPINSEGVNLMIQAKILIADGDIISVANTKQEAESDLLYQLIEYFDLSLHFNPEYNPTNSPTNNPTKERD